MNIRFFFPLIFVGLHPCYATLGRETRNHSDDTYDDAYDYSPRTGYACEGSTLKIECAPGLVIRILRANYGRFSMAICNDGRQTDGWNLECMSSRSLRIVSDMCDREPWCVVPALNTLFGDTCSTTFKYLEIEYHCARESRVVVPPESLVSTESRDPPFLGSGGSTRFETKNSSSTLKVFPSNSTAAPTAAPRRSTMRSSRFRHRSTSTVPPSTTEVERFCSATHSRNIHWPQAKPGETVTVDCPNNPEVRKAFWVCDMNPVQWKDRPDLSGCVSPQITSIQNLLQESHDHFNPGIIEVIAADLVQLTEPYEEVFGGDLSSVTAAMQEAVEQVDEHVHEIHPEKANLLVHRVNQAVLKTSSNLLDKEHVDSWKDLPQAEQAKTATRMISTVESSVNQVARTIQKPTIIINVTVNIVVEVRVINVFEPVEDVVFPSLGTAQFDGTDWADCENTITLTGETVRQLGVDGLAKVVFATYNNLEPWLNSESFHAYDDYEISDDPNTLPELRVVHGSPVQGDQPDDSLKDNEILKGSEHGAVKDVVNSKIISASVNGRKGEQVPLKEPIIYTLEHLTENNIYNPTCSFWEYSEKTMDGKWSDFGCRMVHTNTTQTTCECNHLTNFAVLMAVRNPMIHLSSQQKFALSFVTYFGCILSIVCLLICFVTFFCFKNLQSDRNTIHTNLVACLCLAEIVFLFGIVQTDKPIFCSVIAGVLHYLFLATFAWMGLEGIQLYVLLVEVFEVERSRIKWYSLAAYGIPAFIVAISAIVYHEGYGTDAYCWLTTEKGFIWAFVGPVCAILFVNFIMLSVAIGVMCRHASSTTNSWKMKQKTKFENVQSWVKGAVVLIVLLGLTWTFGLFYINEQSVVMAYLFTIFNSFQGVFIFVFHCVMCDKVMKEYKKWVRHTAWLPESLRVKCGGARASISTTPMNSSSSGVNKIVKEQKLSLEHLTRLLSGRQRKRSSTTSLPVTTSNQTKRGYNRIQRNSSGRESSHLTDSGIACNDDFSHIYSEPSEDPNAYLEPVHIHLDPNEDCYLTGGDMSMIEGSVADTDYFDDFGRRCPTGINVNKYKIMPPNGYNNRVSVISDDNRVSVISDDRRASVSDFSDVDAYTLTSDGKKTRCDLEKQLLAMPSNADKIPVRSSSDSLGRKKFATPEEELPDVTIFNNLNKSSSVVSEEDKRIAEPNIETTCGKSSSESDQSFDQEIAFKSSKLPPVRQIPAVETADGGETTCEAAGRMMKY